MKISEMIEKLENVKRAYGDLECIYAKDDEGNGYSTIHYDPGMMEFFFSDEIEGLTIEHDMVRVCCVN